jgi:hypothetical protein
LTQPWRRLPFSSFLTAFAVFAVRRARRRVFVMSIGVALTRMVVFVLAFAMFVARAVAHRGARSVEIKVLLFAEYFAAEGVVLVGDVGAVPVADLGQAVVVVILVVYVSVHGRLADQVAVFVVEERLLHTTVRAILHRISDLIRFCQSVLLYEGSV